MSRVRAPLLSAAAAQGSRRRPQAHRKREVTGVGEERAVPLERLGLAPARSRSEVCTASKPSGAWPPRSVEHMAPDLGVGSSSPTLGMELTLRKKKERKEKKKQILFLLLFLGKPRHHPLPTPEARKQNVAPEAPLGQLQPHFAAQVILLYLRNVVLITVY